MDTSLHEVRRFLMPVEGLISTMLATGLLQVEPKLSKRQCDCAEPLRLPFYCLSRALRKYGSYAV